MPLRLSSADLMRGWQTAERFKKAAGGVKHKVEGALKQVVRTTELNAMAFGASVLKGKMGEITFVGVPVELAVGVGGHLAGFFGVGGKMNHHIHNFADGALASWVCGRGLAVGHSLRTKEDVARIEKAAAEEKAKLTARVSGDLDGAQGTRLTDKDLARAAT